MATPYLSEIKIMSFGFPPKGWALCNGQLMPINQNQALFSLLGTTYGGDGRVNFALPNLSLPANRQPHRDRCPRRPRTGLGGGECGVFNAAPLPELCRNPGRVETPLCGAGTRPAARAGRATRNRYARLGGPPHLVRIQETPARLGSVGRAAAAGRHGAAPTGTAAAASGQPA